MNLRIGQLYQPMHQLCIYPNEYLIYESMTADVETVEPYEICVVLDIKTFASYNSLRILKPDGTVGWILYLE